MKWTPKNYKKLLDDCDMKIKKLYLEQMLSDERRHELYSKIKNNWDELSSEEKTEINQRCNAEDAMLAKINYLIKLEEEIFNAMDKLAEEIEE
jgi:hypothetical protein